MGILQSGVQFMQKLTLKPVKLLSLLIGAAALIFVGKSTLFAYPSAEDASLPSFVNYETPHVSPIAMTPDGTRLLVVNTADNRLEVFDLTANPMRSLGSVPVGADPVSVRPRNNTEAWVVNRVSDSISVVNLSTMNVERTIATGDEPADVVFAGSPQRAFVSLSQENQVMTMDPADVSAAPIYLNIAGKHPRQLAVSPDGQTVYAAVFASGNNTTTLGVVEGNNPINDVTGPHGGVNPFPNDGIAFNPPINPALAVPPPKMGLIVKKNGQGRWLDDVGGDWNAFFNGPSNTPHDKAFPRIGGWDMVDNDVAVINANTMALSYMTGMMNMVMALSVQPDGDITTVGTDATNEIRFEPVLKARFVRVKLATTKPDTPSAPSLIDINPHLDYSDTQIAQQADPATFSKALVDQSIGDPRAIVWNSAGSRGYVAGMGSNNVIVVDPTGNRVGNPINVGEGPTGLALDAARNRLYVLNRFSASISVINTRSNAVQQMLVFYDPTPAAIKSGRKLLYNTRETSGLGQVSCASCHVDGRMDMIAWDLGNPEGEMTGVAERNCGFGVQQGENACSDFHPMKGPMVTQTLQDIIGHEPHHWRGDKKGLEEFNSAYTGLQGRPSLITDAEMQQFEDFLATVYFPPNPYRNFDNSLPTTLELKGMESMGHYSDTGGLASGAPMLPGNAVRGLDLFRTRPAHQAGPGVKPARDNPCIMCHTLPTGMGANIAFIGNNANFPVAGSGIFTDNTIGSKGESNLMITVLRFGDGVEQINTLKVPQLRSIPDKRGFTLRTSPSLSGFGYLHDGSDTLDKFITSFRGMTNDQEISDIVAFLLAFNGSDLPMGSLDNLEEPPGQIGQDSHAAVGKQVTFNGLNNTEPTLITRLGEMQALADAGRVGLIAHGIVGGNKRGYAYNSLGTMKTDRGNQTTTTDILRLSANSGAEITFTVVPKGSETRLGIDRDLDGVLDFDDRRTQ
jgi:YVTN family beta-propeller protein